MRKLFFLSALFICNFSFSQSSSVTKITSEKQLVDGIHDMPNNNLEKATPKSIIIHAKEVVDVEKPEKKIKDEKLSKYAIKKEDE